MRRMTAFAAYITTSFVARALNLLVIILFASRLASDDFGRYAFLQMTVSLIVLLLSSGVTIHLSNALARGGPERRQAENLLVAMILAGGALCAAMASGLIFHYNRAAIQLPDAAFVPFITLCALAFCQTLCTSALLARGGNNWTGLSTLVSAAIPLPVLLSMRDMALPAAVELACLAYAAGSLLLMAGIFRAGAIVDIRRFAVHLAGYARREAGAILRLAAQVCLSNVVFLGALWLLQRQLIMTAGPSEGAVFALSNQIYNIVIFLPSIVGPLVLRQLNRAPDDADRQRQASRLTATSSILALSGVAVFALASPFVAEIFPAKYQIGAVPLILAVACGGVMFAKFPLSVFFQSRAAGSPELIGSVAAGIVVIVGLGAAHVAQSAEMALGLRVMAHAAQAAVVALMFLGCKSRKRGLEAHR